MAMPTAFDPLIDLDGIWTTTLADRYLPLPDLAGVKYECVNGRLVMSPTEVLSNSFGEMALGQLIGPAVRAAGYYLTGPVNLTFNSGNWIQPDVTVLHALPETEHEDKWVPAELCTMAVEFVSKSSRQQDFVNKPERCAKAGIPYFMRVEVARRLRHAFVELLTLTDGNYETIAMAVAGQPLKVVEPFPMSFDPRQLLP